MRLIETQSVQDAGGLGHHLCQGAVSGQSYAAHYPEEGRLGEIAAACASCAAGECKLSEVKPLLKEAGQIARAVEQPGSPGRCTSCSGCLCCTTDTDQCAGLFVLPVQEGDSLQFRLGWSKRRKSMMNWCR